MTVNERIKDLLKASKHTQKELSEAIQVPRATVGTWVNGRDIPAQFIIPICGFLECSAQYLLTGQEAKKEHAPEISRNGLEMLEIFELLPEREQLLEIGRLQKTIEPMIGDLHRLRYYNAAIMDEIKRREEESKQGEKAGGQSSGERAV